MGILKFLSENVRKIWKFQFHHNGMNLFWTGIILRDFLDKFRKAGYFCEQNSWVIPVTVGPLTKFSIEQLEITKIRYSKIKKRALESFWRTLKSANNTFFGICQFWRYHYPNLNDKVLGSKQSANKKFDGIGITPSNFPFLMNMVIFYLFP